MLLGLARFDFVTGRKSNFAPWAAEQGPASALYGAVTSAAGVRGVMSGFWTPAGDS